MKSREDGNPAMDNETRSPDPAPPGGNEVIAARALPGFEGHEVSLRGWVHGVRSGGGITFLLLRDGTGVCQCLIEAARENAFAQASTLSHESSLKLSGTVRADARAPGGFELLVSEIEVIHRASDFPISRKSHGPDHLMNNRHLWLRSQKQAAIMRVRHALVDEIRIFFNGRGFTLIDTPILIDSAAEGAGTLFPVDFFGKPAYLAQTGQLHLECACMALGKVYCFGPTFRAEKSKTRRHLVEFWMVEPEIAFADLDDVIALAEEMTARIVSGVVSRCAAELCTLERDVAPLMKALPPFPRITYSEAVELLHSPAVLERLEKELESERLRLQALTDELRELENQLRKPGGAGRRERMEAKAIVLRERIRELEQDIIVRPQHIEQARAFMWGRDLGGSDETIISNQFDKPVFITDYPAAIKAFYMKRLARGDRTVRNVDLIAPEGYGEILGGSQREDDLEMLLDRMREEGMKPEDYGWYLDLRRYGSVPHGGFGLGIERTLAWICGLKHVRETIAFPRLMGRMTPQSGAVDHGSTF